jgi:fluoride ion exporter CrcB/FEX
MTQVTYFDDFIEAVGVGLAAYVGVAIRFWLIVIISNYSSSEAYYAPYILIFQSQPYTLPNIFGCFLMGGFVSASSRINQYSAALYKALTVGLCGCITTFSTWMLGSTGVSFEGYAFVLMYVHLCMYWSSFSLGLELFNSVLYLYDNLLTIDLKTNVVDSNLHNYPKNGIIDNHVIENLSTSQKDDEHQNSVASINDQDSANAETFSKYHELFILIIFISSSIVILVLLVLFETLPTTGENVDTFHLNLVKSLLFGPIGAWCRWGLSRINYLKSTCPSIYLHTLSVNLFAVLISTLLLKYAGNWVWTTPITVGEINEIYVYLSLV